MHDDHHVRLGRARASLEGLSVGDAFGERFFALPLDGIIERRFPPPPWHYTDDTQMALSIVATLRERRGIDQDYLARSFAERFDPSRGYGPAMYRLLPRIRSGVSWRTAASSLFGGHGSFGNGAAMRVAPLGAYFADDLDTTVEHARRSAEITHAHPEGVAGAIAVAVAAAWAWRLRDVAPLPDRAAFLDLVLPLIPAGEVERQVRCARDLVPDVSVYAAVAALGSGGRISAQDTVPFVLWCAAQQLGSYEDAIWLTAQGLGDIDTTCAMVGGIVASYTGAEGIPQAWRQSREPLPNWPFQNHDISL
jgi:ADP-ribosylglycohydrolase